MNDAELSRLVEILNGECSCHLAPPCNWCISLEEDEISGSQSDTRKIVREKIDLLQPLIKDTDK